MADDKKPSITFKATPFYGLNSDPLSYAPLTYDTMKQYLTTSSPLSFSIGTSLVPPPKQDAYVEIKVWYPNGRQETVRGVCSDVSITDKSGKKVNQEGAAPAKIDEGFTFSVNGTTKAWKRGPDARPIRERKPRS